MNLQVENAISKISSEAQDRYFEIVKEARKTTRSVASRVRDGKKPIQKFSKLGLKLTAVGHRTADKVLKQQTKLVENQIDAFAGRLKAAANAKDVRDLFGTQIRMIPENAARLVDDARASLNIVTDAGGEVGGIVRNAFAELRQPAPKPAARPAAKKTGKAAKKAGKKPATRKKAAKKVVKNAGQTSAETAKAA